MPGKIPEIPIIRLIRVQTETNCKLPNQNC